jgi:hypothetical protein
MRLRFVADLKNLSKKKKIKNYTYNLAQCDELFLFFNDSLSVPRLYFFHEEDLIVSNSAFESLSLRHKRACILHELGHRELKHKDDISNKVKNEFEADDFSQKAGYGKELYDILSLSAKKLAKEKNDVSFLVERAKRLLKSN